MVLNFLLAGDSVLDCSYTESGPDTVEKLLQDKGYTVSNYCCENPTVHEYLYGVNGSKVISEQQSIEKIGDKFHPLKSAKKNNYELCVLSLGGNDINKNLYKFFTGGIDTLISSVFTLELKDNFNSIIKECKKISQKIVLICPYLPYSGKNSLYSKFAESYVEKIYESLMIFYKDLAKTNNISIIDLSKTLDKNNKNHYGNSDVNLSITAKKSLVSIMIHVKNNYKPKTVYFSPNCESYGVKLDKIL